MQNAPKPLTAKELQRRQKKRQRYEQRLAHGSIKFILLQPLMLGLGVAIANMLTLGFNLYGLYGAAIGSGVLIIFRVLLWHSTKRYLPHITREIEAETALPNAPRTPASFVFWAILSALLLAILIPGCAAFYKGLSEGMENARTKRELSQ